MRKEQKEIRCAELVAVLTDSRDILNELLAYSRQGLSISNIVEYANLFTILNDISNNSESNKICDIAQAWKQLHEAKFFYTEDDLREYYGQNPDYDIFFDNSLAWEEYEATEKRNNQIQEIAIQAALEGVDYELCKSFMREYELTTEEINVFDYVYNNTVRAAEGRYRRSRRIDPNYYLAYKIRRDKELNDWCENNDVVISYNPNTKEFTPFDWGEFEDVDLPF